MPSTRANFSLPIFRCQPDSGVFTQTGQYWIVSYYAGVITLALAAWAVCRLRSARVGCWRRSPCSAWSWQSATRRRSDGWLAGTSASIGLMRFPVKFVILPAFALPMLAACGLAERQRRTAQKNGCFWLLIWSVAR